MSDSFRSLHKNRTSRYICACSPCYCFYPKSQNPKFCNFVWWNWGQIDCEDYGPGCSPYNYITCPIQILCCLADSTCHPYWDRNCCYSGGFEHEEFSQKGTMRGVTDTNSNLVCACNLCFCSEEGYTPPHRHFDIVCWDWHTQSSLYPLCCRKYESTFRILCCPCARFCFCFDCTLYPWCDLMSPKYEIVPITNAPSVEAMN